MPDLLRESRQFHSSDVGVSVKQQRDKTTTVKTIRTAAGLPVAGPDEESSSAESSSSGDTESETECNVQDQGIGRDFVMVDPAV